MADASSQKIAARRAVRAAAEQLSLSSLADTRVDGQLSAARDLVAKLEQLQHVIRAEAGQLRSSSAASAILAPADRAETALSGADPAAPGAGAAGHAPQLSRSILAALENGE